MRDCISEKMGNSYSVSAILCVGVDGVVFLFIITPLKVQGTHTHTHSNTQKLPHPHTLTHTHTHTHTHT